MTGKSLQNLNRRCVKTFLDVLILARLRDQPMSGYDVLQFIHRKFSMLLSSGTVYSTLYSMERRGQIKSMSNGRKRIYTLTEEAKQNIDTINYIESEVQNFIRKLQLTHRPPLLTH
ncbi:MAG: PadR family transcriptional regulator [Thermoproteota archaeon]|nr:PadR family transcriptional regulator [Thermoproteota archaeon]